ncbi:hypothetical protein RBU49_14900 [Clostridium sp. MB40-C1]|uniref:hypothetical protein n=1 Tax=Clostridium sp. MB40-C1 TaxID=3070996 RepID=UPI0027DFD3EC|nr:hypothetical protein [Clostridium sp. MB40-C1]WMJ80100.1 hypothetical protein RBU49_14900 [Clostridium sp. MB40-C1]
MKIHEIIEGSGRKIARVIEESEYGIKYYSAENCLSSDYTIGIKEKNYIYIRDAQGMLVDKIKVEM